MKKKIIISILSILLVCLYPLFLSYFFDANSRWLPFIYFYGFGLFVYALSSWTLLDLGCIDLSNVREKQWFVLVSIGMVIVCLIHGIWTWLAIVIPHQGL